MRKISCNPVPGDASLSVSWPFVGDQSGYGGGQGMSGGNESSGMGGGGYGQGGGQGTGGQGGMGGGFGGEQSSGMGGGNDMSGQGGGYGGERIIWCCMMCKLDVPSVAISLCRQIVASSWPLDGSESMQWLLYI